MEGWFAVSGFALEQQQTRLAQKAAGKFIALSMSSKAPNIRRINQARLWLGELDRNNKEYAVALNGLAMITAPDEDVERSMVLQASVLVASDKDNEALSKLNSIVIEGDEEAKRVRVALLETAKRSHQTKEILSVWAQYLQATAASEDYDLLLNLAMLANKKNQFGSAQRFIKKAIELRPTDAVAYNALGYMLADRGVQLDEANALLSKALSLAPDDASVLDSIGWLSFRRGHAHQAQRFFLQAIQKSKDPEIAAHFGEVLWFLGKKDEARMVWRAARKVDPKNDFLQETMTRFGVTP
jgi:Flp pilus assembly protein TadD